MATTQTVYSPEYPDNTKTITVDMVTRIPLGAEGDEKFVMYVSTSAYSDVLSRTEISPIYIYDMRRGWAQSTQLSSPVTVSGDCTLQVVVDEDDANYVTLTVSSGSVAGTVLASNLQTQLKATAVSGTKSTATNKLSYLNAQVKYEDSRLVFVSGSTKSSFNDVSWSSTSSVKVVGGTGIDNLGFTTGYPNSYDMAAVSANYFQGPAPAHVSIDDVVRFAIMSLANQIDFSG